MRSPAGVSSRPAHDQFAASLVRSLLLSPPVASMYANRRRAGLKFNDVRDNLFTADSADFLNTPSHEDCCL